MGQDLLLIPAVAAVIHNAEGALLLQEKHREGWSLPAGAIEPGESPEEAVRREVLEETGLIISSTRIKGVMGGSDFRYMYPNGDLVEYQVVLFHCTVLERETHPLDPETKSLRYFYRADMPTLALPYPPEMLYGAGNSDAIF